MILKEVLDKQALQEAASKSLARIHQHVQNRNIGMITAHRGEYTAAENKQRNHALAADIKKHGFGYTHVRGRYIENHGTPEARSVDEHSFMVIGKKGHDNGHLESFLKKHGEKYGQDSVLHKPHDSTKAHLIGTKEGGFPGKDVKHELGEFHPNRSGEFHTVMTRGGGDHKPGQTPANKRTFSFEDFAIYTQITNSSRVETLWNPEEDDT
jgi:hypothetical protein